MKITTPMIVLLVMLGGCTSMLSRMNADARTCEEAVRIGALDIAEETCQRALGDWARDWKRLWREPQTISAGRALRKQRRML